MSNYYERLGVSYSASSAEIKEAFIGKKKVAQQLMLSKDPEVSKKGVELIESLTEAYKVLSSSEKRREYNQKIMASKSVIDECVVEANNGMPKTSEEQLVEVDWVNNERISEKEHTVEYKNISEQNNSVIYDKVDDNSMILDDRQPVKERKEQIVDSGKVSSKNVDTKTVQENSAYKKDASNKRNSNGLLIGGTIVLAVIVIIMAGYIGYQEFYAKSDSTTQQVGSMSIERRDLREDNSNNSVSQEMTKKRQFEDYCNRKDMFDKEITELANEINARIGKYGDLRDATFLHKKCKGLRDAIENELIQYRQVAHHMQSERDLERLFELELVRVDSLVRGVEIGLQGGNYTEGFQEGAVAASEFKKLNRAFCAN